MKPLVLPPNIIDHFYRGGARIAELRGVDLPNPFRPEEWLAATNERQGEPGVGLSRTADGTLLRDLIAADRLGWIGSTVGPAGPADNGILVKLLDAGQRLPAHVHPSREFARSHLACPYGKTEAWYVFDVEGDDPSVWLGWTVDVDPDEVARRVDAQDSDWLLGHMNRITVRPGDGILVPHGTNHAIGAGVFVAEVQEPTDQSILLEWSITTSGREDSHLGLGFDVALQALNHRGFSADRLAELVRHTDPQAMSTGLRPLLPEEAAPFFRLDAAAPGGATSEQVAAGFAVVVVLAGSGQLSGDGEMAVSRGQVLAVPYGFGDWTVGGNVRALVCRPGVGWPEAVELP